MKFKIPPQLISLGILFGLLGTVFLVGRAVFVPASFGKYGHYRGDAIKENEAQPIQYAGSAACADCHSDQADEKARSFHAGVACEVCHGPAAKHIKDPDKNKPTAPRQRGLCPLCHNYNSSRPTGFPQILTERHNPGKPCMSCHNPHDPKPPTPPAECGECHRTIASQLMVSPHTSLECKTCHEVPENHKINPRLNRPGKPHNNGFCAKCHDTKAKAKGDKEAKGEKDAKSETAPKVDRTVDVVPQVDSKTHSGRYLCWDCHYPHHPEAAP